MFVVFLGVLAALLQPGFAFSYSYFASGKEILIDSREEVYSALARKDQEVAKAALQELAAEIEVLDGFYGNGLVIEFEALLREPTGMKTTRFFNRAYAAEIGRRLTDGIDVLDDYQQVKVKVAKAALFFEVISGELGPEIRTKAAAALEDCMQAIGSPGVFGTGQRPADPEAYRAAVSKVVETLGQQ